MVEGLLARGWARFPAEPAVARWAAAARQAARASVADPAERAKWLVCEGTWFVGVDALGSDASGDFGAGPLPGAAIAAARALYGPLPLHPAQVSAVWPGYPRPRKGEGPGAFRYRQRRDAAHVDGLRAVGADRRRMLLERHAFILGLPLCDCDAGASPLSLWEGSHEVMRAAFARALAEVDEADWGKVDLTGAYQAARAEAFETRRRITLTAPPGGAYLLHRLTLHGVAPWQPGARAPEEGRMIAYFRPELPSGGRGWLELP